MQHRNAIAPYGLVARGSSMKEKKDEPFWIHRVDDDEKSISNSNNPLCWKKSVVTTRVGKPNGGKSSKGLRWTRIGYTVIGETVNVGRSLQCSRSRTPCPSFLCRLGEENHSSHNIVHNYSGIPRLYRAIMGQR